MSRNIKTITWAYTGRAPDSSGVFYWTIDNFLERTKCEVGDNILSKKFDVDGQKFSLRVIPNGSQEAQKGFVG